MCAEINNEQRSGSARHDIDTVAQSLNDSWEELCRRFLPLLSRDMRWRSSRARAPEDPPQGWKLHLSATVLTAVDVMRKVAPFLQARAVLFKAPSSLHELSRINSGLYYGYSQVGKFITVYPRNTEEAVALARRLHKLTSGMSAPQVPFDLRYRAGSCVYYRYGAFQSLEIENPDGTRTPAIRNPQGDLIPDSREAVAAKPDWEADPFIDNRPQPVAKTFDSPLKTTFRAFRALAQRGKGGVYQALDLSVNPPRLCILKEGRGGGEINWDGRDGYWRVRNEESVLYNLQSAGIAVPQVYSSFEVEGHYYLVTEFIEGHNLQALLRGRRRRLSIAQTLRYAAGLSTLISQIHAARWVWRDCKPTNLIVTKKGDIRPVDFEGACPVDSPDISTWSTPDFAPPEWRDGYGEQSRAPEDVYAVGAIIFFLITGRLLESSSPVPIAKLRRNVPRPVSDIISDLIAADPESRPSAQTAAESFKTALSSLG